LREQLESVAAVIPGWLMLAGGLGGILIVIGNIVSLANAIAERGSGFDLAWPVLAIAFGALLAVYFGYLAILKASLKRDAR
jgi:hypothetical protein